MSLHFPLAKIRTFRFSLHTSPLSLHHGGAEIRNEFTLSIAKKNFALRLCSPSFKWHEPRDEWSKTQDKWSNLAQSYYRKRGSASYIVREVQSVRERDRDGSSETEVVRRKWRHHCRAKIGDKFALSLAKIPTYRFPLHTSRLSFHGEVTSIWNIEKLDQINTKNYWK